MDLFADLRAAVLEAVAADPALAGLATDAIAVEPPRDPAHGDMATNAAMVLAKPAGRKPRDLAQEIADRLRADPRLISAEVAGPGFLNLRLSPTAWRGVIGAALTAGADFGRSTLGAGIKVNVEFVSANPTGPLHVGHTRGAVFGDALARLLAYAGHDVTREYYINDGGAQVDVLARSAYLRYLEAHGQTVEFAPGQYPGDYLVAVGEGLKAEFGDRFVGQPEAAWLAPIRDRALGLMMDAIRADLAALGIEMDVFFSEKSLYGTGRIEAALERLRSLGLVYEGVLEPPKGKTPEDWEPREQTLFRSTAHGDDVDRPIMKSDGSWTYFAPDIAYHWDKIERGFDRLIDVFGADHGGYCKRMTAAVAALSDGKVPLTIPLIGIVKLFKDGAEFKMSKRAGTFVTLADLIDEVGPDVVRFVMLTRRNDAALEFDFDKALEQAKENPVFYVQYAHARVQSMLERALQAGVGVSDPALAAADPAALDDPAQIALVRKLGEWPRQVEIAARAQEPHRIAGYLYDLAAELHGLYTLGNAREDLRFVREEDPVATTQAKLAMARAVQIAVANGLAILGVTPMNEMR